MIADNLAKEIMECSVSFFNASQENDSSEDYLEKAIALVKIAKTIAAGKLAKDKADDHISTLEELKDRELSLAIEILTFVRDAFEKNKAEITAQVRLQELSLVHGQSINWTKVNEMIDKSIDWGKAVILIKEAIPIQNVKKIENCKDKKRLDEYYQLILFISSKVGQENAQTLSYLFRNKFVASSNVKFASPSTLRDRQKESERFANDQSQKKASQTPESENYTKSENALVIIFIIIGCAIGFFIGLVNESAFGTVFWLMTLGTAIGGVLGNLISTKRVHKK